MGITLDATNIIIGLDRLGEQTNKECRKRIERYASNVESYMKRNARWDDRTGDARRGLKANISVEKNGLFRVELSHTVAYGIYLEYREFSVKGRLSILEPTLDLFTSELVEILGGLF